MKMKKRINGGKAAASSAAENNASIDNQAKKSSAKSQRHGEKSGEIAKYQSKCEINHGGTQIKQA